MPAGWVWARASRISGNSIVPAHGLAAANFRNFRRAIALLRMAAPLYWLCGFGFEADSGFGQHTEKVPGRHEKSPMPSASNRPCRAFIARIIKGNSMRFGLN